MNKYRFFTKPRIITKKPLPRASDALRRGFLLFGRGSDALGKTSEPLKIASEALRRVSAGSG